jgi:hypothetical protein
VYGPLLERAQDAVAFERGRAEKAEAELAALGDRIARVIDAGLASQRARADDAEAKIAGAREGIGAFLAQYGDSDILMFKVARDLAGSVLRALDGGGS